MIKKITKKLFLLIAISSMVVSCSETKVKEQNTSKIEDSYFINTTWLLESIDGNKINYPADYKQNFIVFTGEAEGFKLSGFAGCNNISGSYDVGDHGEIGIENIISTKMSCSFSDLENKYLSMLKDITSFKIEGFVMTVYNGKKEIAIFKDAKEMQTR